MRKLIERLTGYLIRRDPRRSLMASAYFLAHEAVIEVAKDDLPNASQTDVYEAGEDVAERMLDVAVCELDGAFYVLERKYRHRTFDANEHEVKCDAQLSENEDDCTCES